MSFKTTEFLKAFDIGDLKFFLLIAKKNLKFILFASLLVSMIVFFISLNIEKKYLSEATIVIERDEGKIINIDEAYSTIQHINRINNVIATLVGSRNEIIDILDIKHVRDCFKIHFNIYTLTSLKSFLT